jgi:flagellar export protein FliJ
MAFRFSLQSVLRLRRSIENQEEKKLMAIAAAAARVRAELQKLEEAAILQAGNQIEELSSGAALGATLRFRAECGVRRRILQDQWLKKLQELEQKRTEQTNVFLRARQKREILEGLRDRRKAEWELEITQREQELMDEAYLIRKFREEQE